VCGESLGGSTSWLCRQPNSLCTFCKFVFGGVVLYFLFLFLEQMVKKFRSKTEKLVSWREDRFVDLAKYAGVPYGNCLRG